MKKVITLLLILLTFGCSDDDKIEVEDNGQWTIVFNETVRSDATPVDKTEKFLFDNERLIQHTVKQRYFEEEVTHQVNLTYFDNLVIATTEGLTWVYTLNADGYASHCVYESPSQIRIYQFSYSIDGYLTDVVESIDGIEFSSASLTYENGDMTSVNSTLNNFTSKFTYEAGEERSDYHLPCLGLLEIRPLDMHIEALYAGLLGKDPLHFTVRTSPVPEDSPFDYTEYTTYSYTFDKKGIPTQIGCRTIHNEVAANEYPNNRSISISFE